MSWFDVDVSEPFKAIFSPHLNFRYFKKIKNFYYQHKLDIRPEAETDRICKPVIMIIEPIEIDDNE